MTDLHPPRTAPPSPAPPDPPRRGQSPHPIPPELREEILRLQPFYGTREIGRRVGLSRKRVRGILREEGKAPADAVPIGASKLDPFRERIIALVKKRLTTTRILREIRDLGYDGGRTILAGHVRELKTNLALDPKPTAKRRFETPPGEEMQVDWSPYRIPIAGRLTLVHALGCLLCASRKLYLRFYRDERQSTLLEALASAFLYFEGVAQRLVLDNMATAVLGRIGPGNRPIWHPRFLAFTRHYGFEPFACRQRDPDRKGKKEKSFRLLWEDFIKGSEFDSWEDLEARCQVWLDQTPKVANLRIHGTTRRVPNEVWLEERPLLIALPDQRFPVHEESVRVVDRDATLSIRGTRFTVPAALADRSVAVRLYAEHFEVLDQKGQIACSRRYASEEEKGRLIIDPTHYATLPRRPTGAGTGGRLVDAFVCRFPDLAPFVEGLQRKMKTLAPIHIRALIRLIDGYGEKAFTDAVCRALAYRRFDANAVQRILERAHPLTPNESIPTLGGFGPLVLGEVEPASLESYAQLDGPATPEQSPPKEEETHGA